MALERRNPLPVGRYWIILSGAPKVQAFDNWLTAFTAVGWVRVETTERLSSSPMQQFAIFSVVKQSNPAIASPPVIWSAQQFGFPNVAGPEIRSSSDAIQKPSVPGFDFDLSSLLSGGSTTLLLLLAVYFVSKER